MVKANRIRRQLDHVEKPIRGQDGLKQERKDNSNQLNQAVKSVDKAVKSVKGQAIFEFIVAAAIFFSIVFYMITFLGFSIQTYSGASVQNNLQAKAFEISQYIVHVNLTEDWPVLSYSKIFYFDSVCNNNYVDILERFDVGENKRIKIQLNESGTMLIDCQSGKSIPDKNNAIVERYAVSKNNSIINVKIALW